MLPVEKNLPERPTIWNLAFPSILTNLLFSMIVVVQTKFVGEFGSEAIAAVGIGQRVFFLQLKLC